MTMPERPHTNGWTLWKSKQGKTLDELIQQGTATS